MILVKRYKWVFIIIGCLLCTALVFTGIYLSSLEPRDIRKALADNDYPEALNLYSSLMAKEPSGRTAGKMVDTAIACKNSSRLYKALQEDIFPHMEISGVQDAFIRGGIAWLDGTRKLNSEVRWLAEQLVVNDIDVSQQIRALYQDTTDLQVILTWSGWVSELVGMDNDCLKVLSTGVMEYISQQPWPDPEEPNSSHEALVQAHSLLPEARVASEMLDLWLNWHTLTEAELVGRVSALTPPLAEPDTQVYWLLRALALTSPLGEGWEHPLDVDVMAELQAIYPNLPLNYCHRLFEVMYDKVKSGPEDKLMFLMEVAVTKPEAIILESPQEALELLHTLVNSDAVSEFVRTFANGNQSPVIAVPPEFWSSKIVMKLAVILQSRWEDDNELLAWSSIAQAIYRLPQPGLDIVNSKEYKEIIYPLYTSWSRPVLVFRDSRGVIMFDLEKWQERVLPGDTCALSPDGSRLVTLEWNPGSSMFRIYDMNGAQLDSFTLNIDLRPRVTENNWRTKLGWPEPSRLYTYYFAGEGYEPPFEDSYCSIKIDSRDYTLSKEWLAHNAFIPLEDGVFRDYSWNLYGSEENQLSSGGTKIDNGQDPDYASYQLGNNIQLTYQQGQLLLFSAGEKIDITPADTTVVSLHGAAATKDAIYMELSCPPYWSEWNDIYCYTPSTGEIKQLMQPVWKQPLVDNRESTGRVWVPVPDNKVVPLLIDSNYTTDVYCIDENYYLAAYSEKAQFFGHFEVSYPLMLYSVREKDR